MEMKSGQILILVLLIVVVALAVGLSVASRNITNLRTSTQTKESQRAFGAAEGGVEDVLSRLTQISSDIKLGTNASGCAVAGDTATCSVPVGDINADVKVKSSSVYESKVELGDVAQIGLTGPTGSFTGNVQVDWAKGNVENSNEGPASIEIAQINGPAPYTQTRWYFQGKARVDETLGPIPAGASTSCTPSAGYQKCIVISIGANAILLRIKPFWANTTVRVGAQGATSLPIQTYDISSSSSANAGVTRKVQVSRTAFPMMPAVFDYSMFSEESIIK
jgi:Tfp pilus assembly protein PilX